MLSSLRGRLLAWLLVPVSVLVGIDMWLTYSNAQDTATVIHDRMLVGSARMIGEHVTYEEGLLEAVVPPAALELFQSKAPDRVYYSVVTQRGALLAGYAQLPAPEVRPEVDAWAFHDAAFRGEPVRIVTYVQPIFGDPDHSAVLVAVAQTLGSRTALARQILLRTMGPQLVLVLVVVAMLWLGLHRALAPVVRMSDEVRARMPGALEPLETARVPDELKPLAIALNDYVHRLERQMSAHSRFVSNAAHQLRTPLAVLNTQVACALRATDAAGKDGAVRSIGETVRNSSRVVNQLLTLSVAESRGPHRAPLGDVDLVGLVRTLLEEHAAAAHAKAIDLGYEGDCGRVVIRGVAAMLHDLAANLVDNALRYTPPGGAVTARVEADEHSVRLRVEDDGPGIPPQERERVFERFYRLHHDQSDGCGLGLAIVREIATAHAAEVILGAGADGVGLAVTVSFPRLVQGDHATRRGARAQFAAAANSVV